MKVYIANKMSGISLGNFPWFERTAAFLRDLGHEVVSPHEMDLADGVTVEDAELAYPYGALWRSRLRKDLAVISGWAEAIAFGPDWQDSAGSQLERDSGYDNAVAFWRVDPDKQVFVPERFIGLSGVATAGKDSAAMYLEQHGWTRRGFAAALKEILYALNPVVATDWKVDPEGSPAATPQTIRVADYVDSVGWDEAKKVAEIRQLLQRLGTEGGRNILGEDTWVRHLMLQGDSEWLCIPDVRFPNEARAIEERGGVVIRIERPGLGPVNSHISERALDGHQFYATVINDSTVDVLGKQVLEIANEYYGALG